jgi:alkaline phosphatase
MKTEFSTIGHSAAMIPVFAKGPHSEIFSGIYDNTDIFKKMFFVLTN